MPSATSTTYLLDTCAWLDLHLSPDKLRHKILPLLSKSSPIHLASISMLEVTRKVSTGKLKLSIPVTDWLRMAIPPEHIQTLPITPEIAMEAYALPGEFHNDPADRLIVATARQHQLTLVTSDQKMLTYPHVSTLASRA